MVPLPLRFRYDCGQFRSPGTDAKMRYVAITLILFATTAVSGCFTIYEQDIEQGNVLTPELVQQVKPGMTRKQVKFILGTPLIADAFHKNRWDYHYTLQPGSKKITKKQQITILFKADRVSRIIRLTDDKPE